MTKTPTRLAALEIKDSTIIIIILEKPDRASYDFSNGFWSFVPNWLIQEARRELALRRASFLWLCDPAGQHAVGIRPAGADIGLEDERVGRHFGRAAEIGDGMAGLARELPGRQTRTARIEGAAKALRRISMQSWPVSKSVMVVSDPVMRSNGVGAVLKTKVSTPAPPVARFRLLCDDATVLADMQHALANRRPANSPRPGFAAYLAFPLIRCRRA
jgi:hypothetical protein